MMTNAINVDSKDVIVSFRHGGGIEYQPEKPYPFDGEIDVTIWTISGCSKRTTLDESQWPIKWFGDKINFLSVNKGSIKIAHPENSGRKKVSVGALRFLAENGRIAEAVKEALNNVAFCKNHKLVDELIEISKLLEEVDD